MTFKTATRGFAAFLASLALLCSSAAFGIEPSITIQYQPNVITQGDTSTFVITISDTSGAGFTGGQINVPFVYPTGVVNSVTPVLANGCGGVLTADPGTDSVQISGVTVGNFGLCAVQIAVTTAAPGVYSATFPAGGFTATLNAGNGTFSNITQSGPVSLSSIAPTIVSNNFDSGPGSLRAALIALNGACPATPATITFAITGPGSGPYVIQPTTPLPPLQCNGTSLDGYTQPGTAFNTLESASPGPNDPATVGANNATIQVVLDGSVLRDGRASPPVSPCPTCDGLQVVGSTVTVRGLAIHSFGGAGIKVTGGSASIVGNYIGTDAGGAAALGNGVAGVQITALLAEVGRSPAEANLISNNGVGVLVQGAASADISGNLIGGKRDGSGPNGNLQEGVYFQAVTGLASTVTSNSIRYNGDAGIGTGLSSSGQVFVGNSSYNNTGIGIDINDNGATPNGTAGVQDFPVITSVVHSGVDTVISGTIQVASGVLHSVQLYHNSTPGSGARPQTEGELLIDIIASNQITLDGTGFGTFTRTIPLFLADNVSATATSASCTACLSPTLSSSEYSPKVAASDPLIVTNIADSGIGSLRDAVTFLNSTCTASKVITFNIPGTGVQAIIPATPLPPLTCGGTVIDGYTQPGAQANTLAIGSNAQLLIEIDGRAASGANGIEIGASGIVVRGLIIDNFGAQAAIFVNAPPGTSSVQIYGNILGDPTGTRLKKNSLGVLNTSNTVSLTIGSASFGDRNVISGNDAGVSLQSGGGTVVRNNYIGTDASGKIASGNDTGINATSAANGLEILDNVIAANLNNGVSLAATGPVILLGNFIGTNESGTTGLGNGFDGIHALNPAIIGDVSPGNGNVIVFNGNNGVGVGSQGVKIRGNSIYGNGNAFYGISLAGVAPSIDHCDTDSGANGLQNYPVITTATLAGGNITLSGTLDSVDLVTYDLDFYTNLAGDNVGNGAGRTFIHTVQAVTSFAGTCSTPWSVTFPYAGAVADLITATATDPSGNTSWFSVAAPVVVGTTAPGAPVIGTAAAGNAQAIVNFTPPASDGGSPITSYTVTSSPGTTPVIGTASPITVPGLTNGTPYTFTVTATNAVGTSAPSAPSNAVTPATVPGAPTIGTATAGNGQATVTFTPPASNGGAPITGYTVASLPTGITGTGTASPITVLGLVNGTTYTFKVTATNSTGNSAPSAPSNAVTPTASIGTPGAPTAVSATAGNAQATVSFTPPTSNGGATITSYVVTSSPSGITATGPASPITVTGLANGTTYTFSVVAVNGAGSGPASTASNAVTPSAPLPTITTTPASLTFAARTISTTSTAQTVTLANNGPGALAIASIVVSGDFAFTSPCGATLAVGATCTIDVTFTPIATGARSGALTITTNAAGSPHTVALSGTGLVAQAAIIQVSPGSADFTPQEIGTTSPPQLFVITNVGNATLNISGITVSGNGFTLLPTLTGVTNFQRCGASLQSGGVCAVQVTFTATGVATFTGLMHIVSNASNSPTDVPLAATGVVTPPPPRALSVPSSVNFGDQPLGTPSAGHAVTITNTSASTVTITDLSTIGDYAVSDTCTSIAGHGTCSPLVTFTPTALGTRGGTLTVRALSETAAYLVDLEGVGVPNNVPQVSLSLTRIGFGNTLIGAPVTAHVVLTNVGQVPVLLQSVLARAHFIATHSCPFSLAPRATCDITIGFFPSNVGSQVGVVEIATNAAGSPHDVQVSGIGCAIPSISRSRAGTPLCGQ